MGSDPPRLPTIDLAHNRAGKTHIMGMQFMVSFIFS